MAEQAATAFTTDQFTHLATSPADAMTMCGRLVETFGPIVAVDARDPAWPSAPKPWCQSCTALYVGER